MTSTNTRACAVGTIRAIGTAEKILAIVERQAQLVRNRAADLERAKRVAFQGLDCLSATLGETSEGAALMSRIGQVAYGLTRVDQKPRPCSASRNGPAPDVCHDAPYGPDLAEVMR